MSTQYYYDSVLIVIVYHNINDYLLIILSIVIASPTKQASAKGTVPFS